MATQSSSDSPKPRRSGGVFAGILVTAVVLALIVAGAGLGGLWWIHKAFDEPGPGTDELTITLPRGAGLIAIANQLEAAGAVSDARIFRAVITIDGGDRDLKAGEYLLPAGASMREIYQLLRDGDVVEHAVTLAEGLTSAMMVRVLNESEVLTGEIAATPADGTLLPETFFVTRGTDRAELLTRMTDDLDALLDELWPARADDLPFSTREEAIILASIVEKETGVGSERPRVAAVFVNRLRRGMRLESDPTIIYGISGGEPLVNRDGERRGIFRSELDDASNPYNTYRIDGLPPTAICNPGRASIAAVLNPPDTDELFFVANGTGGHTFSETYAQHRRAVAEWRRIERERQ